MSKLETGDAERDLTKHDRLVNAWLAVGHDATVDTVASLTGASKSYASQVRQAMEEGDLTEADIDEVTDPDLVEQYRQADAAPSTDGGDGEPTEESAVAESDEDAGGTPAAQDEPPSQREPPSQHTPPQPAMGGNRPPQPPRGDVPQPPQRPPQPPQQPSVQQGQPASAPHSAQQDLASEPIQAEEGLYVPVSDLQTIDATLATLEEAAQFEVGNVPPQQPQHQSALAKLYVAQKARELIGEVADDAVPADEV